MSIMIYLCHSQKFGSCSEESDEKTKVDAGLLRDAFFSFIHSVITLLCVRLFRVFQSVKSQVHAGFGEGV
jgi:hypothetical protein